MSTADYNLPRASADAGISVPLPATDQPLHRLAAVRRVEGISQSTVARRLNTSVSEVRWQEKETSDLLLSSLYQWQEVLEVPLSELLIESDESLSPPVMKRAQMIRLMKTARAIFLRTQESSIRRMAQVLVDQLTEMMPELDDVTPWPDVGQPRTLNELGEVVHRRLSDDALLRLVDSA